MDDIQCLKDLQKQMRYEDEHDNDVQASPRFWSIMDYRIVPASEDYDSGFDQYFYNDGDFTELEDFQALKGFIEEYYEDDVESDHDLLTLLTNPEEDMYELWEYIEENLNEHGYFSKAFVKEEEFLVPNTMFITKEDAKNHLKSNSHHYTSKAHTYAMTALRSSSVSKLWKILLDFDWDNITEEDKADDN